ncbi:site-specific integrase [Streptomyces sp. Amel2xC10]|uniref:site-specific integrase n=1 Tax=Streptomyces sp. Amel2xC10 TaxID=1305826 RepID=UPI002119E1A7|nr:site-specific integrase [Streptomyces sp. Amel2xC10]
MHSEASSSIPATGPSPSRTTSRSTGGPPRAVTRPRSSGLSRGYAATSFPTWVLSRSTPSARESCGTGRSGWRRISVRPRSVWSGRRPVREALPDRYRILLVIGAGLGLRQGEALGLSADDVDFEKEVVHVRRQIKMVRAKLCFALPKGRKVRDVPLPASVARAIRQHMEQFAPVPVTLPWDDPTPAETPVEAKHRRPRTYSLLVTGRERKAINRNYFNSYVWKPALAAAGVIAALDEGSADGARVWEPSRAHGFHALRHFFASEELESGESVVSLARWLGHSDPGFTLRKYSHFLPRAGARGSAATDAIFA